MSFPASFRASGLGNKGERIHVQIRCCRAIGVFWQTGQLEGEEAQTGLLTSRWLEAEPFEESNEPACCFCAAIWAKILYAGDVLMEAEPALCAAEIPGVEDASCVKRRQIQC